MRLGSQSEQPPHCKISSPIPCAAWYRYQKEDLEMIDNQGRCVITDHGAFVLFAGKP